MAKFPDVEYEVIQNRAVPFTKPQHYKKGSTTDTELTGHDNPLPVANYTQNTSGIWLPTSESNPMPTRLTGSNVEVILPRTTLKSNLINQALEIPYDARDVTIVMTIYGVTGDFEENEGISFRIYELSRNSYISSAELTRVETKKSNVGGTMVISTKKEPQEYLASRLRDFIGLDRKILTCFIRWDVFINGSFLEGEGFDVEVTAFWK